MIDPESIHEHPDYQPLSSDADIAVLTLSERLQFTKLIRPICLWSSESNGLDLVVGKSTLSKFTSIHDYRSIPKLYLHKKKISRHFVSIYYLCFLGYFG